MIIDAIRSLFSRSRAVDPTPIAVAHVPTPVDADGKPVAGERWTLANTSDGDPFPSRDHYPVDILEVRAGWVRYSYGTVFPDCRMPISRFALIFRKVQP